MGGISIGGVKWDPVKDAKKAIGGVGKNIEGNLRGIGNDLGALFSGNWSNVGQSLARMGAAYATGGASLMINPKDTKKVVGETGSERMVHEMKDKAANQVIKDQQAFDAAQGQMIANTIFGLTENRKRTPGRSQLMSRNLMGAIGNNNLLSPK